MNNPGGSKDPKHWKDLCNPQGVNPGEPQDKHWNIKTQNEQKGPNPIQAVQPLKATARSSWKDITNNGIWSTDKVGELDGTIFQNGAQSVIRQPLLRKAVRATMTLLCAKGKTEGGFDLFRGGLQFWNCLVPPGRVASLPYLVPNNSEEAPHHWRDAVVASVAQKDLLR